MYKVEDEKNETPNLVESNDELAHCWKFYILAVIMLVAYTRGHGTLNIWTGKGKQFLFFTKKNIRTIEIAMYRNPNRFRPHVLLLALVGFPVCFIKY